MKMFGLIGYPLGHSFSAGYFTKKFTDQHIDAVYNNYPIPSIGQFPELLHQVTELQGLNVTIPYKQQVIPYLDQLSAEAQAIGAVNCIGIINGKTTGYNTDVIGFEQSLLPLLQPHHNNALILGTGGASLAVAYVLHKLRIPFQKVSRQAKDNCLSYDQLNEEIIAKSSLIINTTPLGMFPAVDTAPPIPYTSVSSQHLLYDLVYNPEQTLFLTYGQQRGAAIKNGLEMLFLQAEAAWQIWTKPAPSLL